MLDDELRKNFAENLQYFLRINGFTQADMARYMKISSATAANWANGKIMPRVDKIQKLCNWFGIEKSELLEPRKEETPYYDNEKSKEIVRFLYDNPEYQVLFDAAQKVKPEDIDFVKQFIERFGGTD